MRYALLVISIFLTGAVFAQSDLSILNYFTSKNGLSNNAVGCIRRDSRGFLWIATKEGLNRFDGFQFKKYFSERNNDGSLTHNNVRDILEYKPGQLLIATGNGLSVLNTLTGKFENEKITFAGLKPGLGNTIQSLYKDKLGNIWVNHNGELDILDSNLHYMYRFTDLNWAKSCKGTLINSEDWQTDEKNRLWFLSDTTGINIIDMVQKKVFNAKFNPEQVPYLQHDYLRSFLVDEQNSAIWYAPWGRGLIKYDVLKKSEQQYLFGIVAADETRTINAIVKTAEGNILCFIGGKCFEVNSLTGHYKEIGLSSNGDEPVAIGSTVILKTTDHQYWIGGAGIWLLDKKKETYKEVALVSPGVTNAGECTGMFISPSRKLYCTYKNNLLVIIEKDRNIFSSYKMKNKPGNVFTVVAGDGFNKIWVGSTNGLFLFNEKDKTFSQPSSMPAELRYYNINVMYADNDGDLWIGSRSPFALYHYNVQKNDYEKVPDKIIARFAAFGDNSRISDIVSDKSGNLWMTSRLGGGILCYEKKNITWKYYPSAGKNSEFLQKKGLIALYADDSGFLWFSNFLGDGLIRYDYKNDSLNKFSRSDGLQSDYIQNIFGDKTGRLWLITGYGITSLSTHPFHAETIIPIAGSILHAEPAGILDHTGKTLVLSLPDRVLFISTLADTINKPPPVPVLDKITINNQQLFFNPEHQKPVLRHEQKNITIDFTAVNFLQEKVHFAYKLTGVDKEWQLADITRSAQYSILAPGRYTFIMKSGNEKGDWTQPYELLSFTIHPPWWQTSWFRVLCAATAALLVFTWIRVRERNIKNRVAERAKADAIIQQTQMQLTAQQHKMAEAEMLALRAQMNPHFLFNSLNSINNYILKNDADNAAGYLTKFSRLMRLILDNSRSNWVLLENELKALELYVELEAFRFDNSFSYEINLDKEVNIEHITVPPMIIQPYVENAIWHGLMHSKKPGAHLQIDIYRQGENLCIAIKDNGIGRQAASRLKSRAADSQKSHGMKITAERLEIMNKVYGINAKVIVTDPGSDNVTGTEVFISFRYSYHSEPANVYFNQRS